MAKIKGLDHGYLYAKDNEGNKVRSSFNKNGIAIGGVITLMINGETYSVGSGNRSTQFDKSDSEMNRVMTWTNLVMDGDDEFYLGVGLPIQQFASVKDKFKKQILGYNDDEVIYNGEKVNIKIRDVLVFPQCLGALFSLNVQLEDGHYIFFDFGGFTIDIAHIEIVNGKPILHKYNTFTQGIQKIYPDVINAVNSTNDTLDINFAEHILIDYIKGTPVSDEYSTNDFLLPTFRKFLDPILTEFNLNYPTKHAKIYLCGGSAIIFEDIFKGYYSDKRVNLVPDCQFANANGFYKAALQKFGSLVEAPSIRVCNYRRNA